MDKRTCRGCLSTHEITSFGRDENYKDGYSTLCKRCKRLRKNRNIFGESSTSDHVKTRRRLEKAADDAASEYNLDFDL